MKFQDIDAEGILKIQQVPTKPIWEPSDVRRVIYVADEKILYYGTSEGWSRSTGFGLRPVLVIENYTAEDQDLCLVDSRNGPITITLPPNPKMGAQIAVVDVAGTFETNYCTLQANGKKIQRVDKNLVLDISDFSGSLIYDPLTSSWKVNIDGVVQLLGNATLWVHKSIQTAEDINGSGGQQQFNFEWEYNPYHDNIAVYVQGVKQFTFDKTNSHSITLDEPVPAGTQIEIVSIPLEGSFNIEEFVTFTSLEKNYTTNDNLLTFLKTIDGSGSGLDADLLDGKESSQFVEKVSLLSEILKIDGKTSNIDADMLDGYHASEVATPLTIPVTNAQGKISGTFLPYAQTGLELINSFNIIGGATYLEIPNLDSSEGYLIKILNMTPSINGAALFCSPFNETKNMWTTFDNWTSQYSTALSGGLRDFNTSTIMPIGKYVGNALLGINITLQIDGFSSTEPFTTKSVYNTATYLSTDGNFATLYQSVGILQKSNDVFSSLRLYFDSGLIGNTGQVLIYKFIK